MSQPTRPEYRVLFNQDDTNLFDVTDEPLTRGHVERMVDEVADGGADVLLINPNAQLTDYPSNVWQTYWDGYSDHNLSFFGDIPEDSITRRKHWLGQMKHLAGQCDYLATALEHCRRRGITPGVSIRMNDMHDAPWPSSHVFSRFYREHPQFRLKAVTARDWGATGLDYSYPQVREHYLSLIREIAPGYDFDVLELDFSRFPFYFNRGDAGRHCQIMTEFIGSVRELLLKTSRTIHLIPRIATNPGSAYQLGFDVHAWAKTGLVDGITITAMMGTCWNMPVDEFRGLVGPDIAIYAGAGVSADRRDGLPVRYLPESYEMLRGFAAGYLAAGADGVEVFNYFLARKHRDISAEEFFGILAEMRSLEDIRSKPRVHVLDASYWTVEFDMPEQVPATIRKNTSRRFEMLLAGAPEGAKASVLVYYDGQNECEDLWLRVGRLDVGRPVEIRPGPQGKPASPGRMWHPENKPESSPCRKSKVAVFDLSADAIRDGRNQLVIRSENMSTTVLGIDVCIG